MIKILLILLTVNVFSSNIQANNLCSSDLGTLPIRQNGRTKPLFGTRQRCAQILVWGIQGCGQPLLFALHFSQGRANVLED